jgi:hypothetical protein
MIQRALAVILAASVLPIAAGAAFDQPSPHGVYPGNPAAKIPAQRSALSSTERNDECNSVTLPGPLAAVASRAPAAEAKAESGEGSCPTGMVSVQGEYCTEVRHTCKRWLDDETLQYARCAEYEQPARCVGKRTAMRFCIDREEYTPPGANVPMNYASFVTASKVCKDLGKRICTESEWNFACEGEEMRPYPYGWTREPKCNQDRDDLYVQTPTKMLLKDHREPGSGRPECASPFGVLNMVGNVDEPVLREVARYNQPFRNGLKGGWWMAGRNRCRPATTAHDDYYQDIQVGVRCCGDTPGGASEPSG